MDTSKLGELVRSIQGFSPWLSSTPRVSESRSDIRRAIPGLVWVYIPALISALIVGWKANATGAIMLWVMSSSAVGAMLGFLFGIPKSGIVAKSSANVASENPGKNSSSASELTGLAAPPGSSTSGSQYTRPNTNLEEVSDWLTKIIVGLTLVNFESIKGEVQKICLNAAATLHEHPSAADISTASALVVGFSLLGFLTMYLYMRLFLQGMIAESDRKLDYQKAVAQAERILDNEPITPLDLSNDGAPSVPVVPSAASVTAAQVVAAAAPLDAELVLQPLKQLATEYETLRTKLDYSNDRTRKMAEIVRRMRPYALAAAPYISQLMSSPTPGDHLAATVILQMRYAPEHMPWLARRLVDERAFIGYQAASALLNRVRTAGIVECKQIQQAVEEAKTERRSHSISEPSLDNLIDMILNSK